MKWTIGLYASIYLTQLQVQISSLVMCVTVSASVALCLLFGPKMYLVLLHPEKCARNYPGNKKPANNKTVNVANNLSLQTFKASL